MQNHYAPQLDLEYRLIGNILAPFHHHEECLREGDWDCVRLGQACIRLMGHDDGALLCRCRLRRGDAFRAERAIRHEYSQLRFWNSPLLAHRTREKWGTRTTTLRLRQVLRAHINDRQRRCNTSAPGVDGRVWHLSATVFHHHETQPVAALAKRR